MDEKKVNETGSLYLTLNAFYKPVYISIKTDNNDSFRDYIRANVSYFTSKQEYIPDH